MRFKLPLISFALLFSFLGLIFYFISMQPHLISTAVLIHGCHVETKNWEAIMFGDELNQGRVTSAIEEALREKAQSIIWGSGASITKEGYLESEYTFFQATHSNLDGLARRMNLSPTELLKFLKKVSILEKKAKNTKEEIQSALQFCSDKKIKKLILISSPTHIARCLQEGCKQKAALPHSDILMYARASDVCFADSTPHDVVIVEPPHRTDRSPLPIHHLVQELVYELQKNNGDQQFYEELTEFVNEHKKNEK